MTESETMALVALLFQAYAGAPGATEERADIYRQLLSDLDAETAVLAVQGLIRTSKWLPTIAEIRAAATARDLGPQRSAAEAWGDVTHAIRYVGAYGAPIFQDPAVAAAVRALGWESLCIGDSSAMSDRARFCEIYDSVTQRTRDAHQRGEQAGTDRQLPSGMRMLIGTVLREPPKDPP